MSVGSVQFSLVQFGLLRLSDVGSDISVVLDNSRKSDGFNFGVSGFEVLPKILRRQNLAGFIDPHVPEHTGDRKYSQETGSTVS